MHPELESAIEAMYAAFARPVPLEVDGCPCCITEAQLRALVETPLRELADEQLGSYSFSALLTVGSPDDLRYFWPRMVELSTRGEMWPDVEIVIAKPARAGWRSWPRAEQEAIERFARAWMADLARRELDGHEVNEWICAFGRLFEDVVPLLSPLLEPCPAAEANLFALYSVNARKVGRGKLTNSFWHDAPANEARVADWLRSEPVVDALSRFYATSE
jgi:hypothetical protein